jgi:hypothetical protein
MAYLWQKGKTVVSHLRVKGYGLDPLVTKLRVAALFRAARLEQDWLPPSAILCIRHLPDPLPGALSLGGDQLRPSPAWERAFAVAVRSKYERAVSPARGGVTAETEAVIFSDRSELLACLAQDWCEERIAAQWWWRSLLKVKDDSACVVRAWVESPEYVPAALQHLAVKGGLTPFAWVLSPADALTLLAGITRSFMLPELQDALGTGLRGGQSAPTYKPEAATDSNGRPPLAVRLTEFQFATGEGMMPLPPWQRLVPESLDPALGRERQCLLGVGLTLRRATTAVRTPAFAHAVLRWLKASDAAQRGALPAVALAGSDAGTLPAAGAPRARAGEASAEQAQEPTASRLNPQTSPPPDAYAATTFASELGALTGAYRGQTEPHTSATPRPQFASPPPRRTEREDVREQTLARERSEAGTEVFKQEERLAAHGRPLGPGAQTAAASETPAAPAVLFDAQIETAFGGVFYLINLGLFLNLYADFTSPLEVQAALPVFDFVALLGERLVGERIKADPVWLLLARLAGRDGRAQPGEDFLSPADWRIPAEWLEPFSGDGLWRWTADGGRLCVRHPEGFMILDAPPPAGVAPAQHLAREMETYRARAAFTLRRGRVDSTGRAEGLTWWLENLLAYVRARLRRALGTKEAESAAHMLCVRQARALVTPTHLDVVFPLAALPVEIRLAGLDRNPGWVPAAGRFIAFHYE